MYSRFLRVLLAATGLVTFVGVFSAADAGPAGTNEVVVEKVVVGSAPPDTVFEIEVSCVSTAGPPLPAITTLEFDANGDPLGTDTALAGAQDQCTVTETVTGGATVSYACRPGPCFQDNVTEFGDVGDEMSTITVTNNFEPEPEPEPGVVGARPSFTG